MNRRILVYCRESRDDDGSLFGRIEVQRDILLQFIKEQEINGEIEVVLDNNVSGVDFARLEHIAQKAEAGLVDTLVFKDASRLGRNLRESLNFLHRMEMAGVEVFFEGEHYDSELFPLLAWFNERRAAEDSRKVKRVFEHRMKAGSLIFKAPFGYLKEDNTLVPNELEAVTVRKIFALRLSGYSTGEIADELNRDLGSKLGFSKGWNNQQIRRILANRCYTGDMVYHKTTKPSFKSKKIRLNPPDEWIVIPEHHEAIISRSDFEQAQLISCQNARKASKKLCFSGLLYCGSCGARMAQRRRNGRADSYICTSYQLYGKNTCKTHFIREDTLIALTRSILKPYLHSTKLAEMIEKKHTAVQDNLNAKRLAAKYEHMLEKIYDDRLKAPKLLPPEIYEKKLLEYTEKLSMAQALIVKSCPLKFKTSELEQLLFDNHTTLREVVNRVFSRITVYLPGEAQNLFETKLIKIELNE